MPADRCPIHEMTARHTTVAVREAEAHEGEERRARERENIGRNRFLLTLNTPQPIILNRLPAQLRPEEREAIREEGRQRRQQRVIQDTRQIVQQQTRDARARSREVAAQEAAAERARQEAIEADARREREYQEWLFFSEGQYSEEERAERIANRIRVQYNWTQPNKNALPPWIDWHEVKCSETMWFVCHKSMPLLHLFTQKCQALYVAMNRSPRVLDMDLKNYLDAYFDELQMTCQAWRRSTLHGLITNREQRKFLRDVSKVVKYVFGDKDPYRNLASIAKGLKDNPISMPERWELMYRDNADLK
ncbi:hypothetical protein WOLCODRAFT_19666 [Wolfiporia cocos MD-104 SS10]|uniref:Uncharacterized protein n=1 Tax=Wolfiporia cocos (strain MD-104) TaxID=742152 RepID=A0A2H3IY86_WOLCO|nr:hypothetical protein WOLCODRAFT_19666 [Wolfiporia cocos MD-104 SS10]